MGYDVNKRGFDPDDYQVAARMGGLNKINKTKDFELSQKRATSYKTKSIFLDYLEVIVEMDRLNEYMSIPDLMRQALYKDFTSFYFKAYRPYRHMWE